MLSHMFVCAPVVALLLVGVSADAGTTSPVAKVIKLLEDLKKEVEGDGKKEATSYGKYACFCKDTTKDKSKSITDGNDKITQLSADIGDNTAMKQEKAADVAEREKDHEQIGSDLKATLGRCEAAKAEHERSTADSEKAIASLNKAIKAMKGKKTAVDAVKLAQKNADVKRSLVTAEVMNLVSAAKQNVLRSFLQSSDSLDPSDPAYKYHSKEINDILAKLLQQFKDDKKDTTDDYLKVEKACGQEQDGLAKKMKDNLDAIAASKKKIEELKKKISKDRGDLVQAQDTLAEDEKFLKDLTAQCEEKATQFDQRAQQRADEIKALTTALKILGGKPKDNESVNTKKTKVLLQQQAEPISFLQAAPVNRVTNFLARGTTSQETARQNVLSLLRLEGNRLGSAMLSTMAMKLGASPEYTGSADPFKKAKMLIQKLIERLLDEGHAEAAKKGFCEEEIGKATKDRDFAYAETQALNADLKDYEAKKEALEAELKQLKKDIKKTEDALEEATTLRTKEKKDNLETIKKAKEALEAVNEAILTLKAFYSKASRATVLVQAAPDAGFDDAYKGKQKGSQPIFALLQTIADDFQKTIDTTEKDEADAQATYVKFHRTSKADIASKETKTKLNNQDLKSTKSATEKALDDLKTETGLMGDALKVIEELKPACFNTGMNYEERVKKREEEIKALNKALEILQDAK